MFNTCQASLRGMRQRRDGVIINIASWAGHYAAYSTPAMRATLLKPAEVAHMVTHVAGLPAHVCINDILMSPNIQTGVCFNPSALAD